MLESWIFFIKEAMQIRTIKLILLITKSYSKGLERNIRDVGTLFDVFNRVLALQMRIHHFENFPFNYGLAPYRLDVPHLHIHYGKFVNTYIGYISKTFGFLDKCS
jgi:hypothetical protein